MKLFNYTNFINENLSGDKLYKAGRALNIPTFMKTKVAEQTYEVGDIIKVWDKETEEMVPVVDIVAK